MQRGTWRDHGQGHGMFVHRDVDDSRAFCMKKFSHVVIMIQAGGTQAEAFGNGNKIGRDLETRGRDVAIIEEFLLLAYEAQVVVVEDKDLDIALELGKGGELLNIHEQRAVSGEAQNGLVRVHEGGTNCSRQAEAHGAEPAGGDELPRIVKGKGLGCPHLVLADVGGDNGVGTCRLTDGGNDCEWRKFVRLERISTPDICITVVPGSMEHKGANIQILDIPGLIAGAAMGKGRGKEVIAVVRSADLILLLGDVYNEKHINVLINELNDAGIRLNKEKPDITIKKTSNGGIRFNTVGYAGLDLEEIRSMLAENKVMNADVLTRGNVTQDDFVDAMMGSRVYIPAFFAVNKVDLVDQERRQEIIGDVTDRFGRPPIMLSAHSGYNIEHLKDEIYNQLGFIRIYLKPVGGKADLKEPLIIRAPATVESVCNKLHREFVEKFRYAKVWGDSVKHDAQRVGLNHTLEDGDILTIVTKA